MSPLRARVTSSNGHRGPAGTVSESVAAALEDRVRLLVFDNCEHLRDAAADLVEAILAASATVRILATSREGLRVADEQLWLVPSLDVGAGIDSAAVNLFVERARSVASRFSMGNADEAGGSPWQNAWIESFNGRLRDELLNSWRFDSLLETRVIIEDWRLDYNTNRPHTAHHELTPTEFALQWTTTHQPEAA